MNSNQKVQAAEKLAAKIHQNHYRIDGSNYNEHTRRVAKILKEESVENTDLIIAAHLHHALDVNNSYKDVIKEEFGDRVLEIVKNYKKLSDSEVSEIYPKNFSNDLIIKAYINLANDADVLILRLADKVDNIRTAHVLPKEKAQKVANRSLNLYSPICKLLGLQNFVIPLENEAFRILNPGEYFRIKNYLEENMTEIKLSLDDKALFIKQTLEDQDIKAYVKHRIKHIYSIYKKSLKKHTKYDLTKLYDIAAMRVIVDTLNDVYEAEGIINQIWDPIPEERDDYIQKPKTSGYKSLHNTLKVKGDTLLEVQIRTKEMHEKNEFGVASHAFYKIGEKLKKKLIQEPNFLKDINFGIKSSPFKISHFKDKVYVFTPKGDIIELPRGSNVIDFAYAIHKDIGNSCVGGIVNHEFVKLTHKLEDGDMVEVKTSNRKKPSPDWLKSVNTRKARFLIRKALKEIAQY